tara:strand:- start:1079 stop:1348 length:270 start_codon:yes stop_codon:yes gene_type:complete
MMWGIAFSGPGAPNSDNPPKQGQGLTLDHPALLQHARSKISGFPHGFDGWKFAWYAPVGEARRQVVKLVHKIEGFRAGPNEPGFAFQGH